MNKENRIRDGTVVQTEAPEQSPEILLVINTDKKSIRVASEERGKTDRFDKINLESPPYLNIDKSSVLENFAANYFWLSQKDPMQFRFFKAPLEEVKKVSSSMRELFSEKPSETMQEFFQKYEVKPVSRIFEWENDSNRNNYSNSNILNLDEMETSQTSQTRFATAEPASQRRYQEAMINWEQLKNFGVSRDDLVKMGVLDDMLKGYKTNRLVPIRCNFGSAILKTDARLSFQQTQDGQVALVMHGLRKQPELDKPYFGHIFSDEDKKNLRETGNMGRVAQIAFAGESEKVPYIISIDKLTNELCGTRADKVFIPNEISGVTLQDHEKESLREGKAIFVEDMISKNGNLFNAHLQLNADRRGIEYIFPNDGQFNREAIGGVPLSKQQVQDLNDRKAILLEDMKSKDGRSFSAFVKLNANGNPEYTSYNPDSPEGNREIYIPKEICNVKLTPEDREELRAGRPVYLYDMVNRKGEEFSSYVKADTETGKISYSKTPDGFDERPQFKIPQEIYGVKLNNAQRTQLQDGKSVLVEDMTGFSGDKFSSWVKVNDRMGKLDYYTENPDKPRQVAGQSENAARQTQGVKEQTESKAEQQTANKAEQQEKNKKPANRRKVS
jgi:hypothetical protein